MRLTALSNILLVLTVITLSTISLVSLVFIIMTIVSVITICVTIDNSNNIIRLEDREAGDPHPSLLEGDGKRVEHLPLNQLNFRLYAILSNSNMVL